MASFKITAEELHNESERLQVAARDIRAQLAQLTAELSPLSSEWSGAASISFQQLWAEWHDHQEKLLQALAGISDLMRHAGEAYEQAESAIARRFQ